MGITRDQELVDLFRDRNPKALQETAKEYESYLQYIAFQITENREDTEECINDVLLKAWETIPPFLPDSLQGYLGKLIRNTSLDKYRNTHASKRNVHFTTILSECLSCETGNPEAIIDKTIISNCISSYLKTKTKEQRFLFVRRYYHGDSIQTLAKHRNLSQSKVKTSLFRMRQELKKRLEKEGVFQ